jgi:hypothetical protein
MSTEDKMNIDERRKYLRKMHKRYVEASRKDRGWLLDEMEAVTEQHRKSLIRSMNGSLERRPRKKQRGSIFGPEVDDALRVIAESTDYICPERLTPNLTWLAKHLSAHGEMDASDELLEKLGRVSVSTVRRIMDRIRQDEPRLPRKRPRPRNHLLRDIPMKRIPWNEQEPGHLETDLVHHCGRSASGEYVCSVQMVDVATGWSERHAILGRSYLVVQDGFSRILARIPFPVVEVHPDNGSEFFNHHMLRFWDEAVQGVELSRSRPYQKNDNRFVEQKNSTLVRAYLGYDRLDTVAHALAVNDLYDKMWVFYNLFQPVMRLAEKTWIREEGQSSRVKRRYDLARTPFDRVCETKAISQGKRQELEALRDRVNPRQLRNEIYDLIAHISSLPCAAPGHTENVRLTLLAPSSAKEETDGFLSPVTFRSQEKPLERRGRPQ